MSSDAQVPVAEAKIPTSIEAQEPDLNPGLVPAEIEGWQMHPLSDLHLLFIDRLANGRDLKIIITAKDAETGTGKSTLAFALAKSWHSIFADSEWQTEHHAAIDVSDYLQKYRNTESGSVLIMEEAEQLDARRSTSSKNVDFSHYWMTMRVRQVVSILTLPSTSALDSRLEELADVWIDVQHRGKAIVHDITVNSYDKKKRTPKIHNLEWPDVSEHEEMKNLDAIKQQKIDRALRDLGEKDEQEEKVDKKADRKARIMQAQWLRNNTDLNGVEIGEQVDRSDTWVYNNTEAPADV